MITSDSPITALPGVGEARAKAFKKLGVENIRGLLCHYPRAYQYRGNVRSVTEARSWLLMPNRGQMLEMSPV